MKLKQHLPIIAIRTLLCLLLCTLSTKLYAQDKELQLLIDSILKGSESAILTETCKLQKEKWATILLTREAFTENIQFNSKCDLAGKFTVKVDEFFPIKMKIRKLKNHEDFEGLVKFHIVFTNEAVLKLSVKDAKLTGKKSLYFMLDYAASIDPLNPQNIIKKRLGGELIMTDSKFKKVIKKYHLN